MKIQNKIYITALIVLAIAGLSIAAIGQANDYYVFVGSMNNIQMVNDNEIDMTFPVYYLPVTGSATYTFTSNDVTATLNTTMTANQNLLRIKNAVKADAIRQGFNLKKMVYQPYDIVTP